MQLLAEILIKQLKLKTKKLFSFQLLEIKNPAKERDFLFPFHSSIIFLTSAFI